MADLTDLVRRRLWELGRSPDQASQRTGWLIPPATMERLARSSRSFITEGLARPLARALDVTENRVRRAAGLPQVPDARADISTGPHLRLVGSDCRPTD
jgi:hypothetical protein